MKNLTPRDISQLVFAVAMILFLLYFFIPHGIKSRKIISEQQELIEILQQHDRDRVVADSIHGIYYEQRINELDSLMSVGDRKNLEYGNQIRLLWRNTYELQKDYDSLRAVRPVLPDM